MKKAINENYQKNIDIMKENLKRGMSQEQTNQVIQSFERQLKNANLYNKEGKNFINQLRAEIISHFTKIEIVLAS